MDVVIAIGHDGSPDPDLFRRQVAAVIHRLGTVNASIDGESGSAEWGVEQATWWAASFPDLDTFHEARARILAIGAAHNQDAIAFTLGHTDVASCPERPARQYRDLL